jgi:hypothetical protein
MTRRPGQSKDRSIERRAQALRDNLKRRKAQARGRARAENEAGDHTEAGKKPGSAASTPDV